MAIPETRSQMYRAGWTRGGFSECKGCGAIVEWWSLGDKTKVPLDPDPNNSAEAVSHFKTCPNANDFSGRNRKPSPSAPSEPSPVRWLDTELTRLRERIDARLVVVITTSGAEVHAVRDGLAWEEVRLDLINAANHVRAALTDEGGKA